MRIAQMQAAEEMHQLRARQIGSFARSKRRGHNVKFSQKTILITNNYLRRLFRVVMHVRGMGDVCGRGVW